MKQPLKVFLNCDARYLTPLTVMLHSLFSVSDRSRPIEVHIAHEETFTAQGCREKIGDLVRRHDNVSVTFHDVSHLLDRHRHILASDLNVWAPVIWAGPLIADVLPAEVTGRIICVDVDMLVCHPLDELFDMELGDNIAAAVIENERARSAYLEACEWPPTDGYFNNGTMLVDLDRYRRDRIGPRIIEWYGRYKAQALCTDQDAQNAVFGDRIVPLHPKWNFNVGLLSRLSHATPFTKSVRGNPLRNVLEAVADPFIIHYVHSKPWLPSHNPKRAVYHRRMRELGLYDPALAGRSFGERLSFRLHDGKALLLRAYAGLLLSLTRTRGSR